MSTPIRRTQDEIVARIRDPEVERRDTPFGVERSRYLQALEYENARQFLRADQDPKAWSETVLRTEERVREEIADYLKYAWEKANGRRALSAQRTLLQFSGLLWLLSSPEAEEIIDDLEDWTHYGKPQLVRVSELVDFPWRDHDDGKWVEFGESGVNEKTAAEVLGR